MKIIHTEVVGLAGATALSPPRRHANRCLQTHRSLLTPPHTRHLTPALLLLPPGPQNTGQGQRLC